VRVHDAKEMVRVVRMTETLMGRQFGGRDGLIRSDGRRPDSTGPDGTRA
jgi:hypothetical protein